MGPDGGGGAAGAARAWLAWWVVSAALWLWLVDNTHGPELIVGAGVSAIAATAALIVRQQRLVVLRPRLRWLLRLWRPLVAYPRDMWLLARALPRRRVGRFYALETRLSGDDPQVAAQRVLMQAAASFSPNTYVIGTDVDNGVVLLHQLAPTGSIELDADPLRLRCTNG
jgi:multisubunit Na+/H+ antiporter MnhE subunit